MIDDSAGGRVDRRGFMGVTMGSFAAAQVQTGPGAGAPPPLSVRSEGSGRDIVFLHGWMMDHRDEARTYEPIFARRPGWRRHYLDLPGMGKSPADPRIQSLGDMLDRLLGWIDAELGDRPFALAGTSAGGLLALGIVAQRLARVDGVLLRVPVVESDDTRRDVDMPEPVVADPTVAASIDPEEARMAGPLLVQTPRYAAARRAKLREAVAPAFAAADTRFLNPIRNDPSRFRLRGVPGQLPVFRNPALIVTGRLDDSVGYRDAWRLMPKMPRATFVALDRAEHGLPIDQQGLFNSLVVDWLDRLDEQAQQRSSG